MKLLRTAPLAVVLLAVACGGPRGDEAGGAGAAPDAGFAAPPSAPDPGPVDAGAVNAPSQAAPSFAALDSYLDVRLAAGLGGFALQVYDASDKLVYEREEGLCTTTPACPAGAPPFTVDLVTGIASSTKWVTSTTVLAVLDELVSAGKTGSVAEALDRKVTPILACAGATTGPITDITTRQLLSFTSGVIPDHDCVTKASSTISSCACEILADSAARMSASPTTGAPRTTAHPPGTTLKYGASHHVVAAAVLEKLTGKSYAKLYEEKVKTPLGLAMTYKSDTNLAGSGQASVADYAKFVGAIFHDGLGTSPKRVLSAAAVAEQRKNQLPESTARLLDPQSNADYGLNNWRWCYASFDASAVADTPTVEPLPACSEVFQVGHGGKGGYMPFLDAGGGRYYAVFAMREPSGGGGAEYTPAELNVTTNVRLLTHLAMTSP